MRSINPCHIIIIIIFKKSGWKLKKKKHSIKKSPAGTMTTTNIEVAIKPWTSKRPVEIYSLSQSQWSRDAIAFIVCIYIYVCVLFSTMNPAWSVLLMRMLDEYKRQMPFSNPKAGLDKPLNLAGGRPYNQTKQSRDVEWGRYANVYSVKHVTVA